MSAREAVVIEAVRSPLVRGRAGGAFSQLHPVELLAQVLGGMVQATGIDPGEVDDVIGGCVTQVGEQSANVTRGAVLAAGFPESVPATTVDRQCGSSQQAVAFAAQGIVSGAYDLVVACGVESMSRVPMFTNQAGADPYGPSVAARYDGGLVPQGIAAELVAAKWDIGRSALDEFAVRSHELAADARRAGRLGLSVVPVTVDPGTPPVGEDDGIRTDAAVHQLAALRPAFRDEAYARRFPQIDWRVTAGSSWTRTWSTPRRAAASPGISGRPTTVRPRAASRASFVITHIPAPGHPPWSLPVRPSPNGSASYRTSRRSASPWSRRSAHSSWSAAPVTDGGGALVLMSAERAADLDLRHPPGPSWARASRARAPARRPWSIRPRSPVSGRPRPPPCARRS